MQRNRKCFIVLMLICIFFVGKTVWAASLPDPSRKVTLTVHPNSISQEYLKNINDTLLFDLYKMDDVKEEQDKESAFTLAQQAMKSMIGDAGTVVNANSTADYSGLSLNDTHVITPGTYLLVVRGSVQDSTVVKKMNLANLSIEEEKQYIEGLVTYTCLDRYTFTVVPQIVQVPNKTSLEDGTDEWIYDEEISLKMEESYLTGSIEIVKELVDFNKDMENATFVFQVDTYFEAQDHLYSSNVYAMQFHEAGTKSLIIDGLPVGALVKVSEVYSGISFTSSVEYPDYLSTTVELNEISSVKFTNTFNGKNSGGGGITNHFTYEISDGVGSWKWEQRVSK